MSDDDINLGASDSLIEQIIEMNRAIRGKAGDYPPSQPPQPPQPPRTKRFRSRAGDRDAPDPRWLVEGLIPEDSDVAIYAPFAALKTFVAIDLAMSIAQGCKALGMFDVVEPGPVFFFAGEGYSSMVKKRATAWEIGHGLEPYSATEIMFGDGVPVTTDNNLIDHDIQEIQEILAGRKSKLFVIDTMNRALNGQDEDKSHVASRYLQTIKKIRDRIGGTSLTISHMGKDPERGERGSSGFPAGFDTIIWIEKCVKNEETQVITIQLWVRKQKDADDGRRFWMQSKKVGDSLVLVAIDDEEGKSGIAKDRPERAINEEDVRAALRNLVPHGGFATTAQLVNELVTTTLKNPKTIQNTLSKLNKEGQKLNQFVRGKTSDGNWSLPLQDHLPQTWAQQMSEDEEAPKPNSHDSVFH